MEVPFKSIANTMSYNTRCSNIPLLNIYIYTYYAMLCYAIISFRASSLCFARPQSGDGGTGILSIRILGVGRKAKDRH